MSVLGSVGAYFWYRLLKALTTYACWQWRLGALDEVLLGRVLLCLWRYGVASAFEVLPREYLGDLAACDKAVRGI